MSPDTVRAAAAPSRRSIRWPAVLAVLVLAGWGLFVWTHLRPTEIASDWHGWRQTDTQTIALNFTGPDAKILWPRINWGGDGPGYVETEFQLYARLISLVMPLSGTAEWPGQLISLVAILLGAVAVFAHLAPRHTPIAAVLGAAAFLATRTSPHLATVVMPDALALLAYIVAWLFLTRYTATGRTRELVAYGIAGTLAMLTKPTMAHVGISSFVLLLLAHRVRLKDYRVWVTWAVMVGVLGAYLAHAHGLYESYGNTFGLLVGEDSKLPRAEFLLRPHLYLDAAKLGIPWGLGYVAAAGLVLLTLRRRLHVEQVALAAGNLVIVVVALRYMSDGAGVHYYAPLSLLAASIVAAVADDLVTTKLRYVPLALLALLLVAEGNRNIDGRRFFATVFSEDPTIASIVATGHELDRLVSPGDLIVARSPNAAYDTFWRQDANYHDPRIFYLSAARGWALGSDQTDPALIADAAARGARFVADPLPEHSPALDEWLEAHADLVWSGPQGGRIWMLDRQVPGSGER